MFSPSYHIMRGETIAAARMRNQDQARPLIPEADLQKIFLILNPGLWQNHFTEKTSELRRKWPWSEQTNKKVTTYFLTKNCFTFWIDFTRETQILHNHLPHGSMFLHLCHEACLVLYDLYCLSFLMSSTCICFCNCTWVYLPGLKIMHFSSYLYLY